MKLGTRIKNIRESKGLTRNELAHKIGVTDVSIYRYENNKREPKIETLKKIAAALNVPLTDLMNDSLHHFAIASAYEHSRAISDINNNHTDSFDIKKELIDMVNKETNESLEYIDNLSNFYTNIESLKNNGAFTDIDYIETKINETNLNNFKKFLNPSDLKIALKSLELTIAINNFLEEPKDIEMQRQLQIILDDFNVPKGKKLKLTLVDSE